MATSEDIARLIFEVKGAETIDQARTAAEKLSAALSSPTGRSGGGSNVGFAALEASRALEDLQYGFGGVVNNIPGLVMALGGTAGLTAVISLVAVGVNQLVKHWGDLTSLFEEKNPFPGAATDLHHLNVELDKAKDEMKELEENASLTKDQLSDYNELRERTAGIEKRIADEKQRQKEVAEFEQIRAPSAEREDEQRAGMLREALAPDKERLAADLAGQLRREALEEAGRLWKEAMRGGVATITPEIEAAQQRAARAPEDAKAMLDRLMSRGGIDDLRRVRETLGIALTPAQRAAFAEASPERFAQRAEEARDVALQVRGAKLDETLRQRKARADAEAERVRVDRNTAQMKAIQDAEDIADRQKRDADRGADKRRREHDRQVHEGAAAASRRFGGTAELMAEQGLMSGMGPQRVQAELSRLLRREGVRREVADSSAAEATEKALDNLTDLGGRNSKLLHMNAEMTRRMAERQRQIEEDFRRTQHALEAANQQNLRTAH